MTTPREQFQATLAEAPLFIVGAQRPGREPKLLPRTSLRDGHVTFDGARVDVRPTGKRGMVSVHVPDGMRVAGVKYEESEVFHRITPDPEGMHTNSWNIWSGGVLVMEKPNAGRRGRPPKRFAIGISRQAYPAGDELHLAKLDAMGRGHMETLRAMRAHVAAM